MKFSRTPIEGAWTIDLEPIVDDRGSFARWYCETELAEHGIDPVHAQGNVSQTKLKGTIRGLHLQVLPHQEAKLVRCTQGGIFDVLVDCREGSPTRWHWFGAELTQDNFTALYVPKGCAHGYQTLTDDAVAMYLVSDPYTPNSEVGIRYDDPKLGIQWPLEPVDVSDKDLAWQLLNDATAATFGGET